MGLPAKIVLALCLALHAAGACALTIDGHIDPAEWQDAQRITDFRLTQPLSRAPAPHRTEAWILATEQGLAVGFRNTQPASVPRTRQRVRRDQDVQADRVNVFVDFDGDGRAGYNFTVLLSDSIVDTTIANENQFNDDWDGDWLHAVAENGEGWLGDGAARTSDFSRGSFSRADAAAQPGTASPMPIRASGKPRASVRAAKSSNIARTRSLLCTMPGDLDWPACSSAVRREKGSVA